MFTKPLLGIPFKSHVDPYLFWKPKSWDITSTGNGKKHKMPDVTDTEKDMYEEKPTLWIEKK